jgi:hypothetical protein
MKYLRNGFYLGILLLTFLTACGGATPTGLVNSQPGLAPNVAITVMPPALVPVCTPPVPTIGLVSSSCVNQNKGLGGITYSDVTYLNVPGNVGSWMIADSIGGNVSCNLDNGTSTATCAGTQNAAFQAMICSSCGEYNSSSKAAFVCAKGHKKDGQGNCFLPVDDPLDWCPAGSHYDNALQNCADNVTEKLASPCPPGYPYYTPYNHACWNKAGMVFSCKTFPLQLGACSPKKIPGACSPTSCSPGYTWDQSKCSCVCQSGHC